MESIESLVITAHIKWQIRGFILSIAKCTQENHILWNDGIEGNMEFVTWFIYIPVYVNRVPYKLVCPFSNVLESTCRFSLNVKKAKSSYIDPYPMYHLRPAEDKTL